MRAKDKELVEIMVVSLFVFFGKIIKTGINILKKLKSININDLLATKH
jgi:hypothetical protein